MASLYKRATASQVRILRAVEGAVKNACDAHPGKQIDPRMRRSIAKRAAGTLTAQWPEVLAAHSVPSDWAAGRTVPAARPTYAHRAERKERGPSSETRRSPLVKLWKQLSMRVKPAKLAGQNGRVETLIEVLKLIASMQRGMGA